MQTHFTVQLCKCSESFESTCRISTKLVNLAVNMNNQINWKGNAFQSIHTNEFDWKFYRIANAQLFKINSKLSYNLNRNDLTSIIFFLYFVMNEYVCLYLFWFFFLLNTQQNGYSIVYAHNNDILCAPSFWSCICRQCIKNFLSLSYARARALTFVRMEFTWK